MKKVISVISAAALILSFSSCTADTDKTKNGVQPSESVTSGDSDTQNREKVFNADPEPIADEELQSVGNNPNNFSTKKQSHSYGVAKNGEAHEISKNAQEYFERNSFNAFCLDTKSEKKTLYLTFDCGYENGYTAKILDVLKEKDVNAAFFCTLPEVKENPELIKRMIDEGHIVGNHSDTHPSFAEISTERMAEEIKAMDNYLRENFNYSEPYFRFPKGEYNEVALQLVDSLGFTSVFWSLAYADWDLNAQKGADYAYETVVSRLHPGAVILLHSVSPDNAGALGRIIDKAREEGYTFASLRDYPKN